MQSHPPATRRARRRQRAVSRTLSILLTSTLMVLAGCTAHHDSAKKTPTATPTPEFTVDTTVSNQPKVSDAFGPALWQVDERTAGKAVAVLPSGGLLLDKDGRLTALSPDGRQEWTRQTATGTQRKKNGVVVTSVHMNSLLVNEGKVAASVENIRDVDTTGPNRTGVNLVLIDTANGKVISRVQLSGCGGSAPVSLGGLGFSTDTGIGTHVRLVPATDRL